MEEDQLELKMIEECCPSYDFFDSLLIEKPNSLNFWES
jgi:hypothetical protein